MTVIGIDLGTSNSLVAYWKEDGPAIIPNVLGERLTPSIVSVEDNGEILVGKIAKERLITHPDLTASVFKRDMGTEKVISIGNYNFTPEELSSFIIKSLKADAESFLQEAVTEAVISVPAYFNDNQRKATKRAAEFTGLRVERLISEPTAAALSYGLHQRESDTNFLVFDLGGGTYDVSVLEYFEGVMEVRAIAGDNFLGGEDFTQTIASYFMDYHHINRTSLDEKAYSYIKKQSEKCKYSIGVEGTGEIQWRSGEETYRTVIDQHKFEQIAQPLILRLRQPIERALKDASLTPEDLDAVVLIGGATRMPIVKKIVSKVLGRLPFSQINPDETVALGAAIQAALKERDEALNEIILTDVCPYTLGTDVVKNMGEDRYETGHFYPIIERNTPIPVSKVERFYTASDNQSKVMVEVYQGESRHTKNNHKLGELNFDVKPGPAGSEGVDIRYTYDINGILEVECTSVSTGKMERMVIENNPGSYTPEVIEQKLSALKDIKIHPRERSENRLLLAVGERLYEESLGDKRIKIADMIDAFERVLATQDEQKVVKAASSFKNELDHLERW